MDTQHNTTPTWDRDKMLDDLLTHINRRTGMDFRDYASSWMDKDGIQAFKEEYREVLRDGKDARTLLAAMRWRALSISMEILYLNQVNGRLTYNPERGWDYCVGQYWPTEYRSAACRYLRDCYVQAGRSAGKDYETIKKEARRELGRGIVNRWFY